MAWASLRRNLPGVCTEHLFCSEIQAWRNCRFIFPYSYQNLLQSEENGSFSRGTAMYFSHGEYYLLFLVIPRSYDQRSALHRASVMSVHPPLSLMCYAVQQVGVTILTPYIYSSKSNNSSTGLQAHSCVQFWTRSAGKIPNNPWT